MPRVHKRPSALRDSWRPVEQRSSIWRRVRRISVSLLAGLLVIALFYLLLVPFLHPNTHLVKVATPNYGVQGLPVTAFTGSPTDFNAARSGLLSANTSIHSLTTPQALDDLFGKLGTNSPRSGDVLILQVHALGVIIDDAPYLLCEDFDASVSQGGRYPVAKLLAKLQQIEAKHRLLILDSGSFDYDPRLGVLANEFPTALQREVEKVGDDGLWVLHSNAALERSRSSISLAESVFGHFVTAALNGAADVDGDGFLNLVELYRYVRGNVGAWAAEVELVSESQTVVLLNGRSVDPIDHDFTLLPLPHNSPLDASLGTAPDASESELEATSTDSSLSVVAESKSAEPDPATDDVTSDIDPADSPDADKLEAKSAPEAQPNFASDEQTLAYDAWQLLDKIAQCREVSNSPTDFAPQLWRGYFRRVMILSTRVWTLSTKADRADVDELQQLVAGMKSIVENRPVRVTNEVIQQIESLRYRSPVALTEVRTLGLLEALVAKGAGPIERSLQDDIVAFDAALAASDRTQFDEWMAKNWKAGHEKFLEWRTAQRLGRLEARSWENVQYALRVVRVGEQVAARDASLVPWIRTTIEAADRDKTIGTRMLVDGIGAAYETVAARHLLQAMTQYLRAKSLLEQYDRFAAVRNDGLLLSPELLRLVCLEASLPELPSRQELSRYIESLIAVTTVSEDPIAHEPNQIERLVNRLERQQDDLAAAFKRTASYIAENGDDPHWLREYLNSHLPTAAERVALLGKLKPRPLAWDDQLFVLDDSMVMAPKLDQGDWELPKERAALELQLARLADLAILSQDAGAPEDSLEVGARSTTNQTNNASTDIKPGSSQAREAGRALEKLYRDLPVSIESAVQAYRDLSDFNQRTLHRRRLVRASNAMRLVDLRDNGRLDAQPLVDSLRAANAYDLLAWHIQRWRMYRMDAPPEQSRYLTDLVSRYRLLAMAITNQPAIPPETPSPIRLDGPSSLSLESNPRRDFTISLTSRAAEKLPVWLVVDYDQDLIAVDFMDLETTYVQLELADRLAQLMRERREAAASKGVAMAPSSQWQIEDFSGYPYRPNKFDLPSSIVVPAGGTHSIRMRLQAIGASSRPTKLIVKAIAGDRYIRHAVDVRLSGGQEIALTAREDRELWTTINSRLVLHPLAGHQTSYTLQLTNRSANSSVVDVELFALQREIIDGIPTGKLKPSELLEVIESLQPLTSLNRIEELTIPATGVAVPLRFRPVEAEVVVPVLPSESANDGSANAEVVAVPSDESKVIRTPVRHGLLIVVTDRASKTSLLKRVDFEPPRPRRYVQAVGSYDLARERLSIRVEPIARSRVPAAGYQVQCEFAEPLPRGAEAQLSGVVSAPQYEAILYADVPASATGSVNLVIHVDGYPRAFAFTVPCFESNDAIRASAGELAVSISDPSPQQAFAAPVARIPVKLRVDAPVGAFERAGDVVEVGIDTDRDREFRDEATLKLHSDRQADIDLLPLDTTGKLQFATAVSDFEVSVGGGNLQNARVNLLAKVQVAGRVAWSEPIELVLDQSGPRIDRVQVFPDRVAILDSELEVKVWGGDSQLSGIQQVSVGFDVDRSGKFSTEVAPVLAAESEGGAWLAKLPVSGVATGPVTLLAQASDAVGNLGEMAKVKLEIVTEEEAMARLKAAVNRIVGTATYGNVPVAETEISLEQDGEEALGPVKTDAAGRFVFPAVPPGLYKLNARGVARNKPRFAEIEQVEVRPSPAQPTRVRVELK